jgi:very-short-patch-repair endonuclease
LEFGDLREVDGIPTLSAARTAADLSSRLDVDALARFVDDGLRRGVMTLIGLDRVARRLAAIAPGRSPKKLGTVLQDRIPGYHPSGSELENRVVRTLVDGGLRAPVRQFRIVIEGRVYFLDLAYPKERVAIEVDGFEFHRTRTVFDSDRVRQNDLVRSGWIVLRFTSQSTSDEILTTVRDLLCERSSGL